MRCMQREKARRKLPARELLHGAVCSWLPYEPHLFEVQLQEEVVQLEHVAQAPGISP